MALVLEVPVEDVEPVVDAPVEDMVPLVEEPVDVVVSLVVVLVVDVESVVVGPPVAPVPAVTLVESILLYEGLEGTRTLM